VLANELLGLLPRQAQGHGEYVHGAMVVKLTKVRNERGLL
jgi:hypothetical protein